MVIYLWIYRPLTCEEEPSRRLSRMQKT